MKKSSRQIVSLLICLSIFQYGHANELKLRESETPEIVTTIKYILDEVFIDLNSSRTSKDNLNHTLQIQENSVGGENIEFLNVANNFAENVSQESVHEVKTEEFQHADYPSKKIDVYDSVILPVNPGVVLVNEYYSAVIHTNESSDEDIDLSVHVYPLKSIYDYSPHKTKIDIYGKNDEPKKTAMILAAEFNDDYENNQLNEVDSKESDSHPLKTIYQHKADQKKKSAHNLQTVNNSSESDLVITLMTGHVISNENNNELVDNNMMNHNMSSDQDYIEDPTRIMPTVV